MIGGKVMAFANRLGMMKGDRSSGSSDRTPATMATAKPATMARKSGGGLASRLM
jgi:hypothetical protein